MTSHVQILTTPNRYRLRSIESAIGLMKNIQTSVVVEENWVEAHTSKLQSLPTATSALELDVSTQFSIIVHTDFFWPFTRLLCCCLPEVVCVLWSHYPF